MNKSSNDTQQGENSKGNVYKMVTMRILDNLMQGKLPWRETFVKRKGQQAPYRNYVTGKPYSFINSLLLGEPGEYASFKQIKDNGGTLNKGSKGRMVIYWGEFIPEKHKEEAKRLEAEGKDISHLKIKFPKYYTVFSVKDVQGLKPRNVETQPEMESAENPTAIARMVIDTYGIEEQVKIKEDPTTDPMYDVFNDLVTVPEKRCYHLEEDWFASVFGGLVHSTATEMRCNRETEYKKMLEGEMSVKEELIGEIGSSMILTACGLKREATHEQISAACQKWIEAMNNDYRLIVTASNAAEKAAKLILGEFGE